MEVILLSLVFLLTIFFLLSKSIFFNFFSTTTNLPPSPPSLPLLGHLHLLRKPLHRTLARLSALHGPIIFLRFGSRPVLVVSSPTIARECFTTNDVAFANRPRLIAGKHLGYDCSNLSWAPYGPRWRDHRRIATLEIFSSHRLNSFAGVRSDEVKALILQLYQDCKGESFNSIAKVELKSRLFGLSFNMITTMVSGKRYYGEGDGEETKRFQKIVEESFALSGATNLGDYLGIVRWMALDGLEKKLAALRKKRDEFLQVLIDDERKKRKSSGEEKRKTIVDVMLSLQEGNPEYYTDNIVKGLIMSLISAGTETSAVTIEWAMALLLNHPESLKAAKTEIDKHVKPDQLVQEHDLPNLPYLHAIVSETLRLYPAGPLLVPHESSEKTVIAGFDIPQGTMLIVNAWAIHRDETHWEDASKFKPERFLKENRGGYKEEGYRMMPFGIGRRSCPGEGLAMRTVSLTLACLIQCFEWERVGGVDVDMEEGSGLTIPRVVPLEALCRVREPMATTLSQLQRIE